MWVHEEKHEEYHSTKHLHDPVLWLPHREKTNDDQFLFHSCSLYTTPAMDLKKFMTSNEQKI